MTDKQELTRIINSHISNGTDFDDAEACADSILESQWFKSKLDEQWKDGYNKAVVDQVQMQSLYRNRTPQDGW